jgi:nicotinamidase-related amidase
MSAIFSASAGVALFTIAGEQAKAAIDALCLKARDRGWLVVNLETVAALQGPWRGAATPAAGTGCRVSPGEDFRRFTICGDDAGIFLVSTIDLLLRAHGVERLIFVGSPGDDFRRTLDGFAATQGYAIEWQPVDYDPAGHSLPAPTGRAVHVLQDFAARVSPDNAALVLIDVQNDFCADEGATGRGGQPMSMIKAAVARIHELLAAARKAGLFIVHVKAEYGEAFRSVGSPYRFPTAGGREPAVWTASAADMSNERSFSNGSVEVCLPGTWGGEFVDGIVPQLGEAVITKHRFGAFADTGLDRLLRANGVSSLIVAGVTTNCCVETTAREAVMRDFHLVVAEDCVAVKDHLADLHNATLESLGLYFGLVRPSRTIIDQWNTIGSASGNNELST